MSVRRLHPEQPESFAFTDENAAYLQKVIARYPEGRQASAVIPALMVAQSQEGWISRPAIETVAKLLDMPDIRVLEVATFYTQFQLSPVGRKAHVQVCGTTPCRLRGADDIIAICKNRLAAHPFELSADGDFSWEEVECAGACVNAPMVTVGKDTYEDLTPETFNALIDGPCNRQSAGARAAERPLLFRARGWGHGTDGPGALRWLGHRQVPRLRSRGTGAASGRSGAFGSGRHCQAGSREAHPKVVEAQGQADGEKVPDQHKPELFEVAREGKADDLKLIYGVGPKLEEMLRKLGVYHYDQIAGWNEMNLRWIDQHLGSFRGRAFRDKWIEQSSKLAGGWRPSNKDGDKPV